MTNQSYDTAAVVSITTGRLMVSYGEYLDVMDALIGDSVYTAQIPSVNDELRPRIFALYPELKNIDASGVTRENVKQFAEGLRTKYGETRVLPTPLGSDIKPDPFADIPKGKPVIGIIAGDEESA